LIATSAILYLDW